MSSFSQGKKAGSLTDQRLCMQCNQDSSSDKPSNSGTRWRWMSHLMLWWRCWKKLLRPLKTGDNPTHLPSNATGFWIAIDSRYRWTSSSCTSGWWVSAQGRIARDTISPKREFVMYYFHLWFVAVSIQFLGCVFSLPFKLEIYLILMQNIP